MAFQVSPGVLVQEKDLTRIIPAVSTSTGAFAGQFTKGPLDEIVTVSSEQELVTTFGKPNSTNYEAWFSAANFLQYSNALRVVRVTNTSVSNATESGSTFVIKNDTDYQDNYADGNAGVGLWAARTAGAWGNNIKVSVCPSDTVYEEANKTTTNANAAVGATTITVTSSTGFSAGDIVNFGDNYEYRVTEVTDGTTIKIARKEEPAYFINTDSSGLHAAVTTGAQIRRRWQYYDLVSKKPETSSYASAISGAVEDEIHIVVVDEDGGITGTKGEVLEVYGALSKASDAKTAQGESNYYPDVILSKSNYIYWTAHNAGGTNWGTAVSTRSAASKYTDVTSVSNVSLSNGSDGSAATTGEKKQHKKNLKMLKL